MAVRAVFHGSLQTFCVGKVADALSQIKKQDSLDSAAALEVFIEAVVEADVIKGRLEFPDKTEQSFALNIATKELQIADDLKKSRK